MLAQLLPWTNHSYIVFEITNLGVAPGWLIPREGDRYSKPTTLYHTDIDRILATSYDNLL